MALDAGAGAALAIGRAGWRAVSADAARLDQGADNVEPAVTPAAPVVLRRYWPTFDRP